MKKIYILFILATISINLNAQNWWNSKKIRGNGNVITKTRTVNSFDEVSIGGSFDVNLIDGNEGKITIKGEENIIPYIETIVRNGKLKIRFKENTNIKTTKHTVVTISFHKIEGVSLGGSGDVVVKKEIKSNDVSFNIGGSGSIRATVQANDVKTAIGGSGAIYLKGTTENLKASIAGSGDIDAYGLNTENLKASIAGSGSIQTSVSKKIKASVVGSGSVYYKGNPSHVDTNSIGSGDVINRN